MSTQSSSNSRTESEADAQQSTTNTADQPLEHVPIADLLNQEADIQFAGLTDHDQQAYPDDVSPEIGCFGSASRSFKHAVQALPQASSGKLWATNGFVETNGAVDTDAIRDVHGLDVDALEAAAGTSLEALAARRDADPVVRVHDHKDIVDDRRKALNALGYDVKFRWQIASDSYAIINPQQAYLPILNALQQRGENEAFGWASFRDWGGLLKMVVLCPSLRQTVSGGEDIDAGSDDLANQDGITTADSAGDSDDEETVIYGGFQTGYDFRGTQTLWARPVLFFPDSGVVLPDTGEKYTRRHYGQATNAAHERANNRVPINEWWKSIYDDIDTRMVEVDGAIQKTRAISYDFSELPFTLEECYTYWGVAQKYAETAADRATTLANPSTRPSVFNIQLSLLIALLDEYQGSMASNSYQEYLEVAGELFRKPSMMIQLAMQEHDRQTDDDTQRVLPDDQQTLSDALEDIVDIPGIDVDTEVDLSNKEAQRVQDRVQHRLGDLA